MKKNLLFTFILLSIFVSNAQELVFSDSSIVSLITCSPGQEVYEKFGHTAIRVNDKRNNLDVVFNYGIFDFETENFYYKFIKGETDYQLGIYNTGNFLASYAQRNSVVWEQILNLTTTEKNKLIKLLLVNYEPQNRQYRYNFIFDNCATRPRDKILSTLNGYVQYKSSSNQRTFRQWIGAYVGTDTWLKFGIDLVFGMDADKFATANESMFLPEVLMGEFQTVIINSPESQKKKLVIEKKVLINQSEVSDQDSQWLVKPFTLSLILLLVGILITFWDVFRHRHFKLFDSLFFIFTGMGGIIVAYLMFFSVHPLVKSNLNILWLNPLNLIIGVLIWIKRLRKWMFVYQIFYILSLIIALLAFALSAQVFNITAFPLIVLLLIRSTIWFAHLKHKLYKHKLLS
jgi:hypothetical protein